jgi:pseudaminic acid cytidylyltransferase
MNIAIIPARGGSKRIPGKNSRMFCGKPMIASTDDEYIAQVARVAGAETPFMRPTNLADDFTPTVPVIAHAIETCEAMGWSIHNACCIYPCAPFLQTSDLVNAFALMKENNAHFAYPVTDFAHPIQRAMRRLPMGQMQLLQPEHELTRTQDLEKIYHDTGQFYWGKASAWKARMQMHTAGVGMPVPNWRVVDIDTLDDWKRAELLHELFRL